MVENNNINPIDVQAYLNGIDYPVGKDDVISHATKQGADDMVIGALNNLPDREYRNPAEINEEISNARPADPEAEKKGALEE